ncbi:LysR family transcriptional regulator [Archangium violaceum]|uniref:LysR family transcriptional regulator n=1 Tax=Archangium violaceum TaxID=83451 RepID=UPI00193B959E|nr:LysR family transcriptional regulator [Archangium violaceum]QRK11026.1 LysR family transcriptional regulator [Archangium violaceum]
MKRNEMNDLAAFVAVAEQKSFTRAAATLGMSPSALSHAMRALEGRLGLRLLTRTTRSVSTTEAGERLLLTLRPAFESIQSELTALGAMRDKPAGTVRLTTFRYAATRVLWPLLPRFLEAHPDIRFELTLDDGLTDIVASRYDAGIRFGGALEKDMIAIRVSPDVRIAVVGSAAYFARHPRPTTPKQLAGHRCISYRMTTLGGLFPWTFERDGHSLQWKPDGALVFNDDDMILTAALMGQGLAYVLEDVAAEHLARGDLIRVLEAWCPVWPGCHLYYPSRRQLPPALAALIEALRLASTPERPSRTRKRTRSGD